MANLSSWEPSSGWCIHHLCLLSPCSAAKHVARLRVRHRGIRTAAAAAAAAAAGTRLATTAWPSATAKCEHALFFNRPQWLFAPKTGALQGHSDASLHSALSLLGEGSGMRWQVKISSAFCGSTAYWHRHDPGAARRGRDGRCYVLVSVVGRCHQPRCRGHSVASMNPYRSSRSLIAANYRKLSKRPWL